MNDTTKIKDRDELSIARQARLGTEGVEVDDDPVETDFRDWGLDLDTREREPQIEQPEASEFGVDDRKVATRTRSEQEALFEPVAEDQVSLDGSSATGISKFGDQEHDE